MRRSRLVTLLGGTLLAAFLLPSVALGGAPASGTAADPNIKLGCALVIPAGHPNRERVACRWSAVTGVDVRAYRVWRIVDPGLGRGRHLIARVTPDEHQRRSRTEFVPGAVNLA